MLLVLVLASGAYLVLGRASGASKGEELEVVRQALQISKGLVENNTTLTVANASCNDALKSLAAHLPVGVPSAANPALEAAIPGNPTRMKVNIVAHGLKLPDKPEPDWLKPGPDGKCRDPKTGQLLGLVTVLRGACFRTVQHLPNHSCPETYFDPPPEVLKDPKRKDLYEACFAPYVVEKTPQAETPEKP